MSRIFRWMSVPAIALAVMLAGGGEKADAGGFSLSIGGFGGGYVPSYRSHYGGGYVPSYRSHYGGGFGYGGYGRYVPSYRNYGSRYGSHYRHPSYPHLDYHAPRVIPHRGHFDYVPGHYDLHRGRRGHH